ncbi:MAG: phenylalanine--tRNA ligase subunit beta, partial [Microcystaceae cyanobacterium]
LEKLQTVAGGKSLTLGVRFAQESEKIQTLDAQERVLTTHSLLITANDKPVAIAGVMGGGNTEVDTTTKNIILESALFDGVVIRRSSKSQNLRSESSTRYERGVNFSALETARNRAIALILELTGGQVIGQAVADYRPDTSQKSIQLRLARVHSILGPIKTDEGQIAATDIERILTDLNCQLTTVSTNPQVWNVTVPSYRDRDIEREIDLIEEIARLYGYDRFCDQLPDKTEAGGLSLEYQLERQIRENLRAIGLTELVHYSLVKPQENEVVLANPLFVEYSALRTNLLDGMIEALERNQSQGNGILNAFEIGRIFWKNGENIEEADSLAGVLGGEFSPEGRWTEGGKPASMTWYEAKGLLENVFARLGLAIAYQPDSKDSRLHPGRTASLELKGKHLGTFGQLHPQLSQSKDLPDAVYGFELKLDVLLEALKQERLQTPHFATYSTYPAVERDLAFYSPVELSVAELVQTMNQAGGNLLDGIQLFDDYRGDSVPTGQRSLAFSLAYRAGDRTLTDGDVEPVHNQIREALSSRFAVTLRS